MGKYRTLGTFFDRIFRNDLNANFNDVDADVKAQKARVDNLITATPQPAEVVDLRTDTDGVIHGTAWDRFASDSAKTGGKFDEINVQLADKATKTEVTEIEGSIIYAEKYYRDFSETDDTGRLQRMIDAAGSTGRIKFNKPKSVYTISSTLTISNPEVVLLSDFRSEYSPKIKGTTQGMTMIKVKSYGFGMRGVMLEGDGTTSNPFNPTINGIEIDRADGTGAESLSNLDADILENGFLFLKDAIIANGRNVLVVGNMFSNTLRGVTGKRYPNSECRGYRVFNNRFHSMGYNDTPLVEGESSYCVKIDENAFGNEIRNNFVDFCKEFYIGPVSRSKINDNQIYNTYGTGLTLTPTTNMNFEVGWEVKDNMIISLFSTDTTKITMSYGIYGKNGNLQNGVISGNHITYSRKDGIYLETASACEIKDNYIANPNKYANVDGILYDGISVQGGNGNVIADNRIRSSVPNSVKPRNGINNNSNYSTIERNKIENFTTEIVNAQLNTVIKTKGSTAPTSGTWGVGSEIEMTAPVAGGYRHQVCVTAGTPGTWKGYGAIQA